MRIQQLHVDACILQVGSMFTEDFCNTILFLMDTALCSLDLSLSSCSLLISPCHIGFSSWLIRSRFFDSCSCSRLLEQFCQILLLLQHQSHWFLFLAHQPSLTPVPEPAAVFSVSAYPGHCWLSAWCLGQRPELSLPYAPLDFLPFVCCSFHFGCASGSGFALVPLLFWTLSVLFNFGVCLLL